MLSLALAVAQLALAAPKSLPVVHSADELFARARAQGGPVVVHFWATWCGVCVREAPEIDRLATKLSAEGLAFLFVSLDDPAQPGKPSGYLAKLRPHPGPAESAVLLDAPDPAAVTGRFDPKWSAELPATFVLSKAGAVLASFLGPTPIEAVLSAVRSARSATGTGESAK